MGPLRATLGLSVLLLVAATPGVGLAQTAPANDDTVTVDNVQDVPAQAVPPPVPEEPAEPPRKKPKPKPDPYDVYGFDDGAMQLRPTLEVGAVASTNAALDAAHPKADVGLHLRPSLTWQSEWSRHAWRGSASADWVGFANTPSAGGLTGSAETTLRLDVRRGTHADFSASISTTQVSAGSGEVPGSAVGARQDTSFAVSAGVTHDFGPYEGLVKTNVARFTYGDVALAGGGTEHNADRAYWEPSLTLRSTLGHEGLPLRPYAEVAYAPRFHDLTVDRNGQRRDSQGIGLSLGAQFDDGPLWKGDIAGNFIARSYNDPALKAAMALGLNGTVTWSPTPLWNIVATSGVSLNESEVASVSATPEWTTGVSAAYALRDNLTLQAATSLSLSSANPGLDSTLVTSVGADWQLNPNMGLSTTLQNTWYAPASGSGGYNEQRLMSSIILRP